jgi:hypothetical protein
MKKYKVDTETLGTIYFDSIPSDIYIAGGYQDASDKGKLYFFTFDTGTCLIPFCDSLTGKQLTDINL